jgi:hypothetical protein
MVISNYNRYFFLIGLKSVILRNSILEWTLLFGTLFKANKVVVEDILAFNLIAINRKVEKMVI